MDNLGIDLLPTHRGEKWVGRWYRDFKHSSKTLNEEIIPIIQARVDYIIERWSVDVHTPREISDVLNGVTKKYNGLIYEEDGVIMEIDLFNEPLEKDEESYLFGIGNSKIFNQYLYDNHAELLI